MILASPEKIREYTDKGYWGHRTLLADFQERVREDPLRIALVDPPNREDLVGGSPRRISYGELDRAADAVATALLTLGIGKDDLIMVQLPNIWELAMLYIAVTRTGAVISPLPVQWRSREFSYIARLTGAKAFIAAEEFRGFRYLEMASEQRNGLPRLEHLISLSGLDGLLEGEIARDRLNAVRIGSNDVFTVCWTSGTEADPKGCPLSHNNWIYLSDIVKKAAGLRENDVHLCLPPLVNMAGVGVHYVPWLRFGGTFVLHHPLDLEICLRQLVEEKVDFTILPPAVLNMVLKYPLIDNYDLSVVRTVTSGSAPLSPWALQEFWRRWGIEVVNLWGQNEGTVLIAGGLDGPEPARRASVFPAWGRPGVNWSVRGMETKVVDPQGGGLVTEEGGVGELAYRGPGVIPGYFNRPDLTRQAFDDEDFFYTGDLFQIREGNHLAFFERRKDIIIRGGFKISAQEVENVLQEHPGILDVAALPMPDEVLGEKVLVFIVPGPEATVDLAGAVDFMKKKGVAVYKLPERLEVIDGIPRNPVGKIVKSVLRDEIRRRLAATPRTP
ncbi:MAG: class I adenylate-forming enzyme family protein [Peptococcaceae bacterium]|jgi:acyl-CoA synthetase (AMP-forming)/AMP-acid ligase II|nr:class I adenylate-forming enzyme family protein [Peptococcaceae bacterium]